MQIGFNQATTLKNSDVETDIKYLKKYGYGFIEFQMSQLDRYLEDHNVTGLKKLLDSSSIKTNSLNALEYFNLKQGEQFEGIKRKFKRMCEIAYELQCDTIIVVPSPAIKGSTESDVKNDSVKALNILADMGKKYGIRLAYEYLGSKKTSVNTFGQCYEIIEAAGRDDVGIVLDCFHFYANNSSFKDLEKADPDRIFVFHINDVMDLPREELKDSHRVWPGEGVIPLDRILGILKETGFDGVATIELFNPEYWTWPPEKTISVARDKTKEAIEKYFK